MKASVPGFFSASFVTEGDSGEAPAAGVPTETLIYLYF